MTDAGSLGVGMGNGALNMAVTRRQFMRVSAAGIAASTVGALGFGDAGEALAAGVRPFKLEKATETRNACPYCAVACGVLIYSMGDKSKNAKSSVIHRSEEHTSELQSLTNL